MNELKNKLLSMNYPDFVGFINQWNVLPGAFVTLSKWAKFSNMDENSNLLQIACTTGFQSRELSILTGCKAKGVDLSHEAIKMANYNKERYAPNSKLEYFQEDALKFSTPEKFSHVAIGAGAHFFPDPFEAIKKCASFLADGGCLLASPFYCVDPVPSDVIKKCQLVFGITPTHTGYKDIMSMYKGLEVIYEDRNFIYQETDEELKHYCESTIKRACEIHKIDDEEIYKIMYDRLHEVRKTTNMLRPYQNYAVLVLRYRKSVYPNRFVELF
jgi:SAM-dependent methyltransferase